jgi:2-polyprenyl-3-methyl-5-hydroxy-6-metoxy-1,4-benzoquinol methylase
LFVWDADANLRFPEEMMLLGNRAVFHEFLTEIPYFARKPMASYVCPWWAAGITINNPVRRLLHNPERIVGPYVAPGMTVLDIGCGVGWFSIPMAAMVGDQGRVIALDLQPQMLEMLRRRAEKAGVAERIERRPCEKDRLGVETEADFALIFAMLHEVPDPCRLLGEVYGCLKPGGKLLLAEPPIHVSARAFADEVAAAEKSGFQIVDRPRLRWSHAVLCAKPA